MPSAGPTFGLVGDVYVIRASGAQTGGALCVVEARVSPGGGPPPHVHSREDESFYVLDGEITFATAAGAVRAGPGAFLHMPRGVPHVFRNETDRDARMLFWCTPAGFERLVEAVGTPLAGPTAAAIPPTPEHIDLVIRTCPQFGITILEKLGPS